MTLGVVVDVLVGLPGTLGVVVVVLVVVAVPVIVVVVAEIIVVVIFVTTRKNRTCASVTKQCNLIVERLRER